MPLHEITAIRLLSFGGATLTVGGVLTALVLLGFTAVAARTVDAAIERLRRRLHRGADSLYVVQRLATYGVAVAGGFMALSALGLNLTSFAVFAGALGVGVGLGLQGVVREFVSGLVIIFERRTNVGDFIEMADGMRGRVAEVGPRATRIRTNDAVDIIVPNSKLIENAVTNWTLRGNTSRIHVPFKAPYGSDKARIREAVLAAARRAPFTLPDTEERRTQVWLTGFDHSALSFELVVWPTLDAVKRPSAMRAAYAWIIDDALREAEVEIPVPQLDVRLRSLFGREGEEALRALHLNGGAAPAGGRALEAGRNDAAEDLALPAEAADPVQQGR